MGRINLNPRLAKGGRCYDVVEIARLYGVHPHTVRSWRKVGLTPIDDGRPVLFQGAVLSAFLSGRRAAIQCACPPGTLYCVKCRTARPPVERTVEYRDAERGAGMLKARCSACGTGMNRRARREQIAAQLPGLTIRFPQDHERIAGCAAPRVIRDDLEG
jgi:hypothetical protein